MRYSAGLTRSDTIAIRYRTQKPCNPAEPNPVGAAVDRPVELTRCFLRLANLPNFALDRLSRYEATLWRQAGQILFALDALDRRKPQERKRGFNLCSLVR